MKPTEYGPLGHCIYGLLRGRPFELLALGTNGRVPFAVSDRDYVVAADRPPNSRRLSKSDIEALRWAAENYADLSFDDLVVISHGEAAYQKADGGMMSYEDMLEDSPDKQARIRDLIDNARYAVF